jgi:protoheme IX farnesyltransferase
LNTNKTAVLQQRQEISKTKDLLAFTKFRLTFTVVLSSVMGFGMSPGIFSLQNFLLIIFGGFLVTGASNGFNQIIERDSDKLMSRTKDRPLAAGRMSVRHGILYATIMSITGLALLASINLLSAVLGFLALFIYVVIYTPLKKITPLAVFVGAFSGAIPPMLGYVAGGGAFGIEAGILFAVQFVWQFPHFWAIAWVADDEYKKAGIRLLPSKNGRDRFSANQILLYSLFLIPISLLPWAYDISGWWSAIAVSLLGFGFVWFAFKHNREMSINSAKKVMFASFLYLPLVQLLYLLDKL